MQSMVCTMLSQYYEQRGMVESLLLSIVIIITLGIASQWTAWRFQLPAIVVMVVAGLLIGPVFNIV
ncbi:hypothetical protein D0U04_15555 [Bacillus clarus]|uniref:Putative membrane protein n=1 Tax=Bacillus clarus TaxID=2338372 RepID=A0A090Z1K2_9BACI|nr:hypothetical protein [Bacillus clarus]KFN04253.1 putative membrane protein [Bacillus clarus]RFT66174.1 hypothetical protein D0U04_15555 [Bacillus clarus]